MYYYILHYHNYQITKRQSIPTVSPLHPISGWSPLLFVLLVSIIREGYEDYKRYAEDKRLNSRKTEIFNLSTNDFKEVAWKNIFVGDIVKINNGETFPADIIPFHSSNEKGVCYIETASLDGERNLKLRQAISQSNKNINSQNIIQGTINGGSPNSNLNQFQGYFEESQGKVKKQLTIENFLPRSAKLLNTNWIIGAVIYAGHQSKIMKNQIKKSRVKQSRVEKLANSLILFILLIQIGLGLIVAIIATAWQNIHSNLQFYLYFPFKAIEEGTLNFFTYQILHAQMIPISLVVSLEVVKLFQAYFIKADDLIKFNNQRTTVQNISINEELGQVTHIFTDKTGTLTANKMELHSLFIATQNFENQFLLQQKQGKLQQKQNFNEYLFQNNQLSQLLFANNNEQEYIDNIQYNLQITSEKVNNMSSQLDLSNLQLIAAEILLLLSTCHDCIIFNNEIQGCSIDECVLVSCAKQLGFKFIKRSQNIIQIKINNLDFEIQELERIPFNSDRKRMSILIRQNNQIKLLVKGADEILKERLSSQNQLFLNEINQQLLKSAQLGLRTLAFAIKILSEYEYQEYLNKKSIIEQITSQQNLQEELLNLADQFLEQNLILLGCSSIEDKLQDGVKHTIRDLKMASIKTWMLTGDKLETAESIASSCGMIGPSYALYKLQIFKEQNLQQSLQNIYLNVLKQTQLINKQNTQSKKKKKIQNQIKACLLLEGSALIKLLNQEDNDFQCKQQPELKEIKPDNLEKIKFIFLNCESIICCRCTPKQKANLVKILQIAQKEKQELSDTKLQRFIILAIGDGANDVNMIEQAEIGVGIYGKEGNRAVQASDFAIPQFNCLWRLLFLHGRWCYIRISQMILFYLYKNMLFAFNQFLFAFFCGFSGQTLFDDYYIVFFNMIFTNLPVLFRAIWDQDINYVEKAHTSISNSKQFKINKKIKEVLPLCYYQGQQNKSFNKKLASSWLIQGVIQAVLLFFGTYLVYQPNNLLNKKGLTIDLWVFSIILYFLIIFVINIKLIAFTSHFTFIFVFAILFTSIILLIIYVWATEPFYKLFNSSLIAEQLFSAPALYLLIFLYCSAVSAFDRIYKLADFYTFPSFINSIKLKKFNMKNKKQSTENNIIEFVQSLKQEEDITVNSIKNNQIQVHQLINFNDQVLDNQISKPKQQYFENINVS